MAFGRKKKPLGTLSETVTPTTTGVTQAISAAVPGVIKPQTGLADQAQDMMTPTPAATPSVGELVGQFQEQGEAARAANEERYAQGLGIHEEIVSDFGSGGTMEAAAMDRYQRQKSQDIAGQMQQAVSSGMYGTTRPSTYGTAYEQEVGTPYKLGLAESMAQRKAEAMRGKAGFIERREDTPPDPALMAGMVERASARPEEDVAAATGTVEAPTSLWKSGQTGAVTAEQFSVEAQRQQYFKTYTAQVSAYKTQIKQYEDAAKRFEPGSPQQAHYAKIIENLSNQLKTAEGNLKDYGEEKAGISSVQYAEEEQRRSNATQTASTTASPSMASVGYKQGSKWIPGKTLVKSGSWGGGQGGTSGKFSGLTYGVR